MLWNKFKAKFEKKKNESASDRGCGKSQGCERGYGRQKGYD